MTRKIVDLLLLLVFFVFLLIYKDQIRNNFQFLVESPCDRPITYRLGEIDKGYGIKNEQFLDDLDTAAKIWDSVVSKKLFKYEPEGKIIVNLIYSDRQALSDSLNKLENKLSSGKESLSALEAEYKRLEQDFEQKLLSFNQKVEQYNKKKDVSQEEYNSLLSEQDSLKKEADQLNSLAKQLNISVGNYNLQVGQYNQTANNFNTAIKTKPEAGLYDGSIPKIDIYLTSGQEELIHTLSHEMGHALGLNHTQSPQSIMYPYTNEILVPDSEEISLLQTYCRQKNIEIAFEKANFFVVEKLQQIKR